MAGSTAPVPEREVESVMDVRRRRRLNDILEHGERFDRQEGDRLNRYRNITEDTGELLSLLIQALSAQRILEVGTSNGYSTLWLADAAEQTGGKVTTIEVDDARAAEAAENFVEVGLSSRIALLRGDARELLPRLAEDSFDLVFLDAERSEYLDYWPSIEARVKRDRGLLVIDNAISHHDELVELMNRLHDSPRYATSLVPVGKGEFLALSKP